MITSREKEILSLIAEGFSSKQIAERICVSFHTVEAHRKNMRTKFNARNMFEVMAKVQTLTT
jgi:DNA-binding NarL/FixJ family response regulator